MRLLGSFFFCPTPLNTTKPVRPPVLLFVRQVLIDPHRGSSLGTLWLYLQPLVMILIYTLVFSHFMRGRIGGIDSPYAYSLYLIPGLLLWNFFAGTIQNMVGIYQHQAHILRKLPIPLLWLPAYIPIVEGINLTVGLVIFAFFATIIGHPPTLSWFLLLPVTLGVGILAYALGLFGAALAPFIPDLRPFTPIALQLAFWLTPIIYVPGILPPWAQDCLSYHPLHALIRPAQELVLYHHIDQPRRWAGFLLVAILLLLLTARLVRRLEKGIRDLL